MTDFKVLESNGQFLVDQVVEGYKFYIVTEALGVDGVEFDAQVTQDRRIRVTEKAILKRAEKHNTDAEEALALVLLHELGHVIAGHMDEVAHGEKVSYVRVIQREVEAWMYGRQIAVQINPWFTKMYDRENFNNVRCYINLDGWFTEEIRESLWNDCVRTMNRFIETESRGE